MSIKLFVAILHPKADGLEAAARLALVGERVKDAAHVHVEKFEPFGHMPIVNEVGYASVRRAIESGASHFVFIASDYLPCENFVEIATKAIEARPEDIITFSAQGGAKFLESGWYTSVDGLKAAFAIPMEVASKFLAFMEECVNEYGHAMTLDQNVILYAEYLGAPIYHTVPSLVDGDPDASPSTDDKVFLDAIDWTQDPQVFVGRETAQAHWRLISCLKPEHRKVREAYKLETIQPVLSAKLQAKVAANQGPREFASPDTMMPFVRQVVAGEYDFPEMPILEEPVILDIGANIGAFALWCKRKFPKPIIHCYEPHPDNFKLLTHNLSTFEIPAYTHEVALATGKETATLYDGLSNCGEASLYDTGGISHSVSHEVSCVAPELLLPADIIKIDTEGAEWDIISHYQHFDSVKAIMLEWHSAADKVKITEFLKSHGFHVGKDDVHGPARGVLCFVK